MEQGGGIQVSGTMEVALSELECTERERVTGSLVEKNKIKAVFKRTEAIL